MQTGLEWASWIVTRRSAIDRALQLRTDPPAAASAESEALRRFRSFAAAALRHGEGAAPALDGLRVDPEPATRALEAWCEAAVEVAGARGEELRALLDPLAGRFRALLLGARAAGQARRAPRTARRAVVGAIDRIADAFLAVDIDDGVVVDANPAAAALLRLPRPELLGAAARRFVHSDTHGVWREELDELVESPEPRRFRVIWVDALLRPFAVEAHATRILARERPLALVMARVL